MRWSPQLRKVTKKTRNVGILFIALGVLGLCGFFVARLQSEKFRTLGIGIGFVLVGYALPRIMPVLIRRAAIKSYSQKPDRDMVINYELSEQGVACRSEVASSDLRWQGIPRVVRTADGFMLYLTDMQVHWLPARSFQNKEEIERFARLAKAKAAQYEEER